MARKIYYDTKAEAIKVWKNRFYQTDQVYKVPHGRHKGKYVVCSYLGYINEMYYI